MIDDKKLICEVINMRGPNRKKSYWRINEEWYDRYTDKRGRVKTVLTKKAPKEARKSFRAYKRYIRIRKLLGTW